MEVLKPPNPNTPIDVWLGVKCGLPKPCVVNCDNLRTISRQHLTERIGQLQPSNRMFQWLSPRRLSTERAASLVAAKSTNFMPQG